MSIYEKLTKLQNELKAPKNQKNDFGKYNYRSAEDILEAVKPLLGKYKLTQIISDDIELIGDRYYLKATVTLVNNENADEKISVTALAREADSKRGMDDSQITGAASSYARKYALNGLYAIDDTKDSDTNEFKAQTTRKKEDEDSKRTAKMNKLLSFIKLAKLENADVTAIINSQFNKNRSNELTMKELDELIEMIKKLGKL